MSPDLGQSVVIVSRDGGSGLVGMRARVAAAPLALQPHLLRNTWLGPVTVTPVCNVTEDIPGVMVRADSPWRSLPEMVAATRARPLSFGSPGANSALFLGVHQVRVVAGGEWTHVPFRGDAARLRGNRRRLRRAGRAGQTRLVAVFSGRRHPEFPDVPTPRAQGMEAVQLSHAALFAPRGLPQPIPARLERACQPAMETEGYWSIAQGWGVVPDFRPAAALAARLARGHEATRRVLRELGVQPERCARPKGWAHRAGRVGGRRRAR